MRRPVIGITANHSDREKEIRLSRSYIEAIVSAGGLPVILPVTASKELIDEYIKEIDGLLLTGGIDIDPIIYGENPIPESGKLDPLRDFFELELVKKALKSGLSILGICKGCQLLNIALGGTLYQDLYKQKTGVFKHFQEAPRWYPTHRIKIDLASNLYKIIQKEDIKVNSIHHQAIKEISPFFNIVARSSDGVIEAIEKKDTGFVLGVQWHPERLWEKSRENYNIFREFIKQSGNK